MAVALRAFDFVDYCHLYLFQQRRFDVQHLADYSSAVDLAFSRYYGNDFDDSSRLCS